MRPYEAGEAQPFLDILKKIATTFNVTTDWLIFEDGEREPQLELKFEAVKQMTADEQKSIKKILDAMILKHQAKHLIG